MRIRKAIEDDLEALLPAQHEVQQIHVEAHPSIYRPVSDADLRLGLGELFRAPDTWVFIATEGQGEPALGFLVARLERKKSIYTYDLRILHIDQMAVRQAAHRRGIGQALVETARAFAHEQRCTQLTLDVLCFNQGARAFYQTLGFEPLRDRMVSWLE